jgi:hypothetical protein
MECFAARGDYCIALKVGKCHGPKCSFYRTPEAAKASIRKAYARIAELDYTMQEYISIKYYLGMMPWTRGERA